MANRRVTNADLSHILDATAAKLGMTADAFTVGGLAFDQSNGGIALVRIANARGGEKSLGPRMTKGEMYNALQLTHDLLYEAVR